METIRVRADNQGAVDIAAAFKALGDPTRLSIFEFLCSCCCAVAVEESGDVRRVEGPTAGEVCCRVTGAERITSTISFHLKELRQAGLITMDRRGKNMVCAPNPAALAALTDYLRSLAPAGGCRDRKEHEDAG